MRFYITDNPEYYDGIEVDRGLISNTNDDRLPTNLNEERHSQQQQRKSWAFKQNNQNGNDSFEELNRNAGANIDWNMPPGQGLLGMAPPNFLPMGLPPTRPNFGNFSNFSRGNPNRGGPKRGLPYRGMNRGGFRGRGSFKGNNYRGGF